MYDLIYGLANQLSVKEHLFDFEIWYVVTFKSKQ